MDKEYFKIVRLKTGESILCSMSSDVKSVAGETHLFMNVPVQVIHQTDSRRGQHIVGESFVLRPWIGLSDSDEFVISCDIVLTIGDQKKEVREYYINYVTQTIETQRKLEEIQERHEAAEKLLREINNGKLTIIDDYYEDINEED